MALPLTVDSLDSVPEALRTAYVADGDKFKLDVDGLPDVTGLKNTVAATRAERDAFDAQLKAWKKTGKSPDEIAEMIEAARVKEEQAALKAGKFDEILAKKLGESKQERDAAVELATKARDTALGVARSAIINSSLADALTKGAATAEGMAALPKLIGDRVKLEFDENGTPVQQIMEADGKTPMVGSGPGGLATFADLVKEAEKNFPSLFKGNNAGGGGKPAHQNSGGSGVTKKSDLKSEKDKAAFAEKHGVDAYKSLPD